LRRDHHRHRERIRAWRVTDLFGDRDFADLRVGEGVREPYPRHWHEELSLCLHTDGGGTLELAGSRHVAPPRCLFVVPAGEIHANDTDERGCSFRSLYLPLPVVARVVDAVAGRPRPTPRLARPVIVDAAVRRAFLALHRALERGGARLEAEERLAALFALLLERHVDDQVAAPPPAGRERAAVRRVRERLDAAYADNVSLDELAGLAGMSPYHLARVFRAEVGMPPHAYQTAARLLHAKRLIREGLPLAAVAAATGFVDQSHFSRHFRWLVKVTPGAWQEGTRRGLEAAVSPAA
jgi:AraC-like DNA-binding protein